MPRHVLLKEQTAKCAKCKHGRAAHKGWEGGPQGEPTGACRMKHCKCEKFHA